MRRSLPRLEQIEAFIEAANGPTFRAAADRCALSPAAFSRRIQSFSDHVGVRLFERTAGGARLTEAGREFLIELEPPYLELRRAAEAVGDKGGRSVTISLSHSLAVGWLIPRLENFHRHHADISLSIKTDRGARAVRSGDADLGICFSDIDVAGLAHTDLLDVSGTPVAAPGLARTLDHTRLGDYPLFSLTKPEDQWDWWSRATGHPQVTGRFTRFELIQALYETASQGLGVAIGASPTIWPYLESGRLERIGLPVARFPGGYRLAAAPDRKRRSAVGAVWQWLEEQAATTPTLA
ncbi:MAG: LysR family transcriptional regulator [Pseudomonadota bacterium]